MATLLYVNLCCKGSYAAVLQLYIIKDWGDPLDGNTVICTCLTDKGNYAAVLWLYIIQNCGEPLDGNTALC